MHWQRSILAGLAFVTSSNVLAQSTAPSLAGFLSAVQSIASVLEPTTTSSSSSTSSTSSPSSITSSPSTIDSSASTAAATSSSTPIAGVGNASSGLDPQTRNIILGVTIPIGLLLLAAIIILLIVCCRRRRRKTRRVSSPQSQFINNNHNNDWERGNTAHHGYNSDSSLRTGPTSHGDGYTALRDPGLLMSASHKPSPVMAEHPAYRNSSENSNIQNPFIPTPPISRKPVPSRDSTGSNISTVSGSHHNNHHAGMATGGIIGAGAVAAVAAHKHNKHRRPSQSPHRPESWHQPLSSHPHDPSMHATAGPTAYYRGNDSRRSSIPFSPDDVGSTHRSSGRFSQTPSESPFADSQAPTTFDHETILAPTTSQRRSLQSRNSSYSDVRDVSRGPSQSPKRRSLTGGGEIWQAGPVTPAVPNQNRFSNSDTLSADSTTPPTNLAQNRYNNNSEMRHTNPVISPALPSNRHITRSQRPHLYDATQGSSTADSSSGESWQSAQAEINPWEERDTGRYPRFSGASGNSTAPLMPPTAAWDDRKERRWSGDMFNKNNNNHNNRISGNGNGFGHGNIMPQARRNSGAMEKRRLRFSDGEPEIYNEQGLVGRAL